MDQGADDRNLNFVCTVQILWNSLMDLETPAIQDTEDGGNKVVLQIEYALVQKTNRLLNFQLSCKQYLYLVVDTNKNKHFPSLEPVLDE